MTDQAVARPLIVDLSGQVALVTGASQGIGRSIAISLGQAGAKVACIARSEDKLAKTVETIRSAGGTAEAYACDVADSNSVQKVVDAIVEKWEKVSVLVNNAGVTRDTLIRACRTTIGTLLSTRICAGPFCSRGL